MFGAPGPLWLTPLLTVSQRSPSTLYLSRALNEIWLCYLKELECKIVLLPTVSIDCCFRPH